LYNHRAVTWKNVESYMNEICPILTGGYCQLVSCIHLAFIACLVSLFPLYNLFHVAKP
ncbi:hypothetical protein T11_12767, partial [Trichinella zimbabwensis]